VTLPTSRHTPNLSAVLRVAIWKAVMGCTMHYEVDVPFLDEGLGAPVVCDEQYVAGVQTHLRVCLYRRLDVVPG
jgi:hypothetical protein